MWKKFSELAARMDDPGLTVRLLVLILLLAAVPRLFLLYRASDEVFYHNDGVEYMEISRQLAQGNGFSLSYYRWHEVKPPGAKEGELHTDLARTPLFPLLGAGLFFLPWEVTLSAKAVSLVLSLLAVVCVFLLGREIAGRACGLWSALLFAFYPYALYYAASWSTENLFLITLSLSLVFLVKVLRGHFGAFGWCGFFLGLAALTRPTAILLPVLFAGVLWLRFMVFGSLRLNRKRRRWYRTPPAGLLRGCAVFLLALMLLILPWMYRNRRVAGSWNPATYYDGYIFWLSFSRIMTETYRTLDTPEYTKRAQEVWDEEHEYHLAELRRMGITEFLPAAEQWRRWGWERIRRSPRMALGLIWHRFLHYWRMCPNLVVLKPWQIRLIRSYFTVLLALAAAGVWRMRRRLELPVLLMPVFFGLAVSVPFLFVLRFRFPFFAPYVCVLAGIALAGTGNYLKYLKKRVPRLKSVCNPEK
ncbi:MAG: glycosyltransferase family 39 protein [Lentisphaeria bacterium]|nr:glycosyltransferase family 39 protein [Lentisphaeria bacterium]